ncbi:hypothetical protein QBC34DRAFT_477319 [Podospora aff. communis PSN243]|uniref:Uncharacterized protein n=1 Tax=Podospora aff. communis PSN243 TaxID=3040156 RepID=A0AAV9GWU7_9PEZI|nr:hypothetical protein QBC34DRAFT_477319 [Podospora aff. communis PSN243]
MEENQSDTDLDSPHSHHLQSPTVIELPLPASVLLDRELFHKATLRRRGNITSGCPELDDYTLLGGFERGFVVGISSEDEDFALRIGLQTVANLLVSRPEARARIVTTLTPVGLLPKLREALAGEVVERRGVVGVPGVLREVVYGYFGRVEISRVFDFEGLGDVVGELEGEGVVEGGGEGGDGGVVGGGDAVEEGRGFEDAEGEVPAVAGELKLGSGEARLSGGALPVRTVLGPSHGPEVTSQRESDTEPACGQVLSLEVGMVHQTSTAVSDPDSSPLSSPPTSPVDPRAEVVPTLPDIRPIPERVRPHIRKAEIMDSEDIPDSTPPNSSPLSSPPQSSPPVPRPEAGSYRPVRLPVEIPDSETESPDTESTVSLEELAPEPLQAQSESQQPELPKLPEPESPTPVTLDEHQPEPPPPSPLPEEAAPRETKSTHQRPSPKQTTPPRSPLPDFILITHTSTLFNTLFTGRDKPTAHEKASLLSTRLHQLTRSPNHGSPLIFLLNSTTSPFTPEQTAHTGENPADMARPPIPRETDPSERLRSITEPTLRSVFGMSPATAMRRGQGQRGKPSFGGVFAQMLDVHLLCTRVPRGIDGGFMWVVEVLLDKVGVYDFVGEGGEDEGVTRRCREQRWGALEVDGRGRIVGAFK